MQSYQQIEHWKKYQPFFPERWRSGVSEWLPKEVWWPWKRYQIHLDEIRVSNSPLTVILLHGAGGYGRFLGPLAVMLAKNGYSSVAPDLPGYGISSPKRSDLTYDEWIACVVDLIDRESSLNQAPVVIFGLSLGGMLSYHAAAKSERVKGVIATTLLDLRRPDVRKPLMRSEVLSTLGLHAVNTLPSLTDRIKIPVGRLTNMKKMSANPEFNHLVLSDRYGGANWVPCGFFRTLVSTLPAKEPEAFHTPLLLAHPSSDTWTDVSLSKPYFDRLAGPKKFVELENCGHAPIEAPGVDQLEIAVVNFLKSLQ